MVAMPFEVELAVWDQSDHTDTRCGGLPVCSLTTERSGKATHLGKFTIRMTFCCIGLTSDYWATTGSFAAADGDDGNRKPAGSG
ncbi:hypothetical protein ACFL3S_09145, partial [Gemmatimonadota bacterium]